MHIDLRVCLIIGIWYLTASLHGTQHDPVLRSHRDKVRDVARSQLEDARFWRNAHTYIANPAQHKLLPVKVYAYSLYSRLYRVQSSSEHLFNGDMFTRAHNQTLAHVYDDASVTEVAYLFQQGYNAWITLRQHIAQRSQQR